MRMPGTVVVTMLILGLTACGEAGGTPQPTEANGEPADPATPAGDAGLQEFHDAGKIVVGYATAEPFTWTEDGTAVGMEPDTVSECIERLGLPETEWIEVEFAGLIPSLQSKRFDMAANAMSYRVDRAEVVDPGLPMYYVGTNVIVKEGNPLDLHSYEELLAADGDIGYITGHVSAAVVQEDFGERARGYGDDPAALADLEADRLIATFQNDFIVARYLTLNPDAPVEIAKPFEPLFSNPTVWYYRDDAEPLIEAMNGCLREMKEDGTLARILEEYNFPTDQIAPNDAPPAPAPDS